MRSTLVNLMAAVLAISGLGFVGGCATPGSGPLKSATEGGQILVDGGGSLVVPEEPATTTVWVYNSAPSPVTLVSASLMPVPGYPAGRLVHVAVATTHDYVGGGHGWPPGVPVEPFKGAVIGHGEHGIVFGISGAKASRDYMGAGLTIVYRYQGREYTAHAWSFVHACVVAKIIHPIQDPRSCDTQENKAWAKVRQEAGDS